MTDDDPRLGAEPAVATTGPAWPAPTTPPVPGAGSASPAKRKPRRPAFAMLALAAIGFRLLRGVLNEVTFRRYGFIGVAAVSVCGIAIVIGWRVAMRRKAARQGGAEMTDEQIRRQILDSGLGAPAFEPDGSLLGSSILVVNQRTKLVEINTDYQVFGGDGASLGYVVQIGQGRARRAVRLLTAFDQFLTHHFEIFDANDQLVLRLTRPRKWFRTKVNLFDPTNRYLGSIRQRNVFGKIRFALADSRGNTVGELSASNWRAWDFTVADTRGVEVAAVVKSWEGWARTAFTRSDRYVVRIHRPLDEPLRSLTVAAALSIDLALKQDARSFG